MTRNKAAKKPRTEIFSVRGRKLRQLLWDIETSPNIGLFWRAGFDINILHDAIIKERSVITIAYKFAGEKKVRALAWDKNQCDKAMLAEFSDVAKDADEAIAHFGDRFDLPWVRTRMLYHGLNPLSIDKTIDTKAWASKYFYFNSNKLDYIAKLLGIGGKLDTEFSMWKEILLDNNRDVLARMVEYNKHDVVLLEKVYDKLKLHVKPKSHAGVLANGAIWSCPRCGSEKVSVSKTKVTASGVRQFQMHCRDGCGGYYSISSAAHEEYQNSKKKPPVCEKVLAPSKGR
jgi:hypothetical protein